MCNQKQTLMNKNYFLKSFRVVFPFLMFLITTSVTSQTCPDINERVYATNEVSFSFIPLLGGGVSNQNNAIDGDPNTHSTINTGIAVLGIGTTRQDLSWGGTDIAANTPVSVKLGIESGVLAVGSSVTIEARLDGSDLGIIETVTADLLSLVSGESVYEFTFTPSQVYDEIRIIASAPIGIGFSVRVYEAYYHTEATFADCSQGDFIDLFYGVEDLGVGVLTGTVGVLNPENVIDGDVTTYATLFNGAALLAQSQLTAVFSTPITSDDQVEVVVSDAATALSIEALNGFTIQRYYGNTAVGTPIAADNNGLSIGFLGSSNSQAVVVLNPQDGLTYDRIKISLGGVADVLNGMRIHEITRKAGFNIVGASYNIIHLTPGSPTTYTLEDPSGCTTFTVTDHLGNPLTMSGTTFELPSGLQEGQIYSFYVQGSRYGCTFGEASQITVLVGDTGICPGANQRVYATNQSNGTTLIGGIVTDGDLAVDGDASTHSTITVGLGVVGLGTTYQDISWGGTVVPAGTPVSIKLGPGSGLLGVASGLTVVARKNGVNVGTIESIDATLLSLLSGENVYEYTFIPSFGGVLQEYDEIRIMLGGVLAAGISVDIYEVYYHTTTDTFTSCDGDILDLFYGVEDLGIGVLTGTAGVNNPWNVADGDTATYAELSNNISLLAQTSITAVFASPLQGNDQAEIMVSSPSTGLSVIALNGLTIQRYYGAYPIGEPITVNSNTVSINFLGTSDNEAVIIVSAQDGLAYDRIKISLGGVAEILSDLRIHEITRAAGFQIDGVQDSVIYWETGDSISYTIQEPTTCTTFVVTDQDGNPLLMTGNTFELPANMVEGQTYYFYVQPYRYGCPFGQPKQIVVLAGDYSITPGECPEVQNRVYATTQTSGTVLLGGTVTNGDLAIDGDPLTHSTISVVLGVAGLGSTYQDISWGGTVVPAGTPVSIKLGPEYGVLSLASGLTAVARKDGANIGTAQNIDGALLSLLPGENVYEFTFTPSVGGVPQEYDEVRINLGGLLAAGVSVRVFEVYYHTPTDMLTDCGTGEVLDLFYGVEDLGIQALTATVGVEDAWQAVDGDEATFAIMYNGASVLAQAHLTTIFSSPSVEGDTIEIFISKPGEILTLGLLEGFTIQRYYGTEQVGGPIDSSSAFLSLGLLNPGDSQGTVVFAPEDGLAFDRIKISLGGVANVLDGIRIHEITRTPSLKLSGSNDLEVVLCSDDLLSFDPIDDCTTYLVEDNVGNQLTSSGDHAFELPIGLIEGTTYTFFVQALRYGCSVGDLQEIEVTIMARAIEADLTDILVNGQVVAPLCLTIGEEVELEVALSATSTIINPVFVWYDANDDQITGGINGTLNLGELPAGTYTYSVGVYGDDICETLATDRKVATFTIEYSGEPTDIAIDGDGDEICFTDTIEFKPSTTITNAVYNWYYTNDTILPITDGDTDGEITFAITASGVLTVSGLAPGTTASYYVSVTGDGVCENKTGDLAVATVTVYDIDTPTTTDTSQEFCVVDAPTVADIQVNESGVIWYDAPTGGTAFASTDALTDGIYYGVLISAEGCESSVRLQVTITLNDADVPTTADANQEFCEADAPTVADIQVNESDVIWYDAPTGGTTHASTDALTDGIYYGALVSAEGCESSIRLEVTVTLNDADTPTTNEMTQEFCVADTPTVANIQVNEADVIWYDAPTGGTAHASTDTLTDGIYYGALVSDEGCESSIRLEVTVTLNDAATPTTTDTAQVFCGADTPTVADIQVNEADVIWYDAPTGGTAYVSTDALTDGIYYGALISDEGCESSVRLEVTVTLINPATPTTIDTAQEFCLADAPTVADIVVNEPGVTWYDTPTGGIAYDSNEALTDGIYYGALASAEGCEGLTRLEITVTVTDALTPTGDSIQTFCLVDAPTVADLIVNEADVIWFDAPTGGTAYTSTDLLINGTTYYGGIFTAAGCESATRLEVVIVLEDPSVPTTDNTLQVFCLADNPTIGDIQVNESGVIWYDAPTGGTVYDNSDALTDGMSYYAAMLTAEGCESVDRLEVSVEINDASTPTTTNTNQEFCLSEVPTIADILVNESGVVWYDTPTGGTAYLITDELVSGTYYAALVSGEGCESSVRLQVNINVLEGGEVTITSDVTGEICLNTIVTYTTEAGQNNYDWEVVGGNIVAGGSSSDNFVDVIWNFVGNGYVAVGYEGINDCYTGDMFLLDQQIVVCADLTINKEANNLTPMMGEEVIFTITVNNAGPNDFENVVVSEVLQSGFEYVSSQTTMGTYSSVSGLWQIDLLPAGQTAELTVIVKVLITGDYVNIASIIESTPIDADPANNDVQVVLEPLCLSIFNEFSPNGDGVNEYLVISCIENYPNNEIKIFDKYGSLVFKQRGYTNNWNGVANVSGISSSGKVLPSDTYYYVLDLGDGSNTKTGWLFIIK